MPAKKKTAAKKVTAKKAAKKRATAKNKPAAAMATPSTPEQAAAAAKTEPNYAAASAFKQAGFEPVIAHLEEEIRVLYLSDKVPWIIGYSGGKDSTAVLQLVWSAIAALPPAQHHKPIHVISTDTLVENPIVASWVAKSLGIMRRRAEADKLPFQPHPLAA